MTEDTNEWLQEPDESPVSAVHQPEPTPPEGDTPGRGPASWAPVLEDKVRTRRILRWLTEPDARGHGVHDGFSREDGQDFRPRLRPPVPLLTILDDGSRDYGEDVRLRGETFCIGRTEGDLQLPNDQAVSHSHAVIRRVPWKGGFQWQLQDLDSRNGTFARCARAVLHDQAIVIIGSRRFRFRNPLRPNAPSRVHEHTRMVDNADVPAGGWPSLAETATHSDAIQLPLRQESLTLGRVGGGVVLEIDDPLLAHHHATLRRMRDGTWMIEAELTRNGIWISINTLALGSNCYFRCGEQQFRFLLP